MAAAAGRAALLVALGTFGSKLLGFARDTVLADRFGSGPLPAAYFVAAQIPLVLFAAVGVGIGTVFIPVLAGRLAAGGRAAAEHFAANVNGVVTLVTALLIVLLELAAGPAVRVMGGGFDVQERQLAILMVRIMSPLILFYAWSAILGGVLNVLGVFGPNAAMGIPQNLVIIGAIVWGSLGGRHRITDVAWGGLVGTLLTVLVQWPALRRARFRLGLRLDVHDPHLRRLAVLVVPAALTVMAQQLAVVVDKLLASYLGGVLLSDLTYAGRLQILAYSILGLSVSTVIYPRLATAAGQPSMAGFRHTLLRGLGLVNFVTVPLVVGLFLLRTQVVRVLFQHGAFGAPQTVQTAYALGFFTLGTLGFAWQDYLNRAFFAMQDTRQPLRASAVAMAVTVGLDLLLVGPMRQGGLALGTALGWTAGASFLAVRMRLRLGPLGSRALAGEMLRTLLAALAAFVPAAVVVSPLAAAMGGGWVGAAGALGLVLVMAAGLYAAACRALSVRELSDAAALVASLRRRLVGMLTGARA